MEYIPSTLNKFKSLINSSGTTPSKSNLYAFNINAAPSAIKLNSKVIELLTHYAVSAQAPAKNIMTTTVRREHAHYESPYGISYEPLNVTFYMDSDYVLRTFFKNWYNAVHDYGTNGIGFRDDYTTDLTLYALYKNGNVDPSYKFEFKGAYPKSISGINYDASASDQTVMFTVEFQYERMEEFQIKTKEVANFGSPEIKPSLINIREFGPENDVSLLGNVPSLGGIGAPFLRDLPSESDEIFNVLNSMEKNLDQTKQLANSVFSKFSPIRKV